MRVKRTGNAFGKPYMTCWGERPPTCHHRSSESATRRSPSTASNARVRSSTMKGLQNALWSLGGVPRTTSQRQPARRLPHFSTVTRRRILMRHYEALCDFVAWRLRSARRRRGEIYYTARMQMACPEVAHSIEKSDGNCNFGHAAASSHDFNVSPMTRL